MSRVSTPSGSKRGHSTSAPATRKPQPREPLSREAIVITAIALADESGHQALSMRKLAKALGFEVMSLYNHITNKQDLLSLMLDRVASQIHNSEPDVAPLQAIRQQALSVRSKLVKHPWAASIWQQHMPGPARIEQMETMLHLLSSSGLDPDLAHHGFHAVNNHILGYTLQEQDTPFASLEPVEAQAQIDKFLSELSPTSHAHTIAHVNQHLHGETESSFELVLDLILNGLVQLNSERRA